MGKGKDSTIGTIAVALAICLFCSVFVSASAVYLKPLQSENKLLDKRRNILKVVGLYQPGQDVNEAFKQFEPRVVDMSTGKFTDAVDPTTYDERKASDDPEMSTAIPRDQDIASVKRKANYKTVYLVRGKNNKIRQIVVPVHGYGLWSTLYGFVALEGDANTVSGLIFYEHAETPGLGGEVDNPKWRSQWQGKKVYDESGEVAVRLAKGGVDPSKPESRHAVDSLSGATLTSVGVENLLKYWLGENGFQSFLENIRANGA